MNLKEVEKHVNFDILIIVFAIVTFIFSLIMLLTDNVSAASDYHDNITNAIFTGTQHCTTNQTGLCVADTSSTTYSRYTFGSTSYQNTVAINFVVNTGIHGGVNGTVRLTGQNWANVNYTCMSSHFSCRVVRANSSILNINFSNTGSNSISGVQFFIQANGSSLNTNSTFIVNKADLYETYISGGSSSTGNNSDIINNQNQNTQDIINNQNENTDDILINNNQNTADIISHVGEDISNATNSISSGLSCPTGPLFMDYRSFKYLDGYLNSSGSIVSNSDFVISPYVELKSDTQYKLSINGSLNSPSLCFYRGKSLNEKISCISYNSRTEIIFTTPSNTGGPVYTLFSMGSRGIGLTGPVCNNWEKEAQQKGNDLQQEANDLQQNSNDIANDTNNYLKDDSNPNVNTNGINNALNTVRYDDPLNYLLTLPLHAIQRINTKLSSNTCSPINLGSLFGTNLTLPCLDLEDYLGSSLFGTIDVMMGIGLLAVTLKKFYDSISNILTLGKEKEIESKLDLPTPMEFLAMIFGGGN